MTIRIAYKEEKRYRASHKDHERKEEKKHLFVNNSFTITVEERERTQVQYAPQWLHFLERANRMLNSLLHFLQASSAFGVSIGGGGPLSSGRPLMSAMDVHQDCSGRCVGLDGGG